ncbi:DUF4232 domain-containing protein [Micromonospora robiginosa]|uniref:DUF4232 domain-containing protein n=1 Tax=Micromonospora robiginosa TaxID=2749844 RepID=A0A7L6B8H0_9ACTN|nr:DUF4232 domain-containing protein [Micromonospora ferruginea]QLQ38181.1 DUF4232 domain-containing protein [Micromonospora ferruginea]
MRNAAAGTGLLAALTLLAACTRAPAPVDPPSGPVPRPGQHESTPPGPTTCPPDGVRIAETGVSAAMGLRAMGLDLVNCGNQPYELRGYPAVRLRDADGDPITVHTVPGAAGITSGFDAPPTRIVLLPGERAGATLLWRNTVTDSTVAATEGRQLDVAPQAGRPSQPVTLDGPIDLGNTGRLGLSVWKRLPASPTTQPAVPDAPPSTATTPVNPL